MPLWEIKKKKHFDGLYSFVRLNTPVVLFMVTSVAIGIPLNTMTSQHTVVSVSVVTCDRETCFSRGG